MTTANGVCKAVSEVVTPPSSYQNDQPKPDSDGITHHKHQNNPDNLNAFMNGDSGLSEDLEVNKDVVELDSNVLSGSELVQVQAVEFDSQNEELDTKSAKISELLNEGHDAVEGTNEILPEENGICQDQQNSLGDEGHDAVEGTNEILPEENGICQDQQNSLGDEGHEITNGTNGILPVKNDTPQDQQNSLGDGDVDGVQGADDDAMEEQVGKAENGAAVEIKEVQDQTGKAESNAGDEIEQVHDQNGKTESLVLAKAEIEKVEDWTKSESFPSSIENQESQARVLGLDTQLGENVELNNLLSDINVSCDANDKCTGYNLYLASSLDVVTEAVECEDANDKCENHNLELASSTKSEVDHRSLDVVTEAVKCEDSDDKLEDNNLELVSSTKSEVDQGSIDVFTDSDECESRNIEVGEVISENKIEELAEESVETSECQVPITTSLHLDPKSWPLINEEKRETESESDVVENQKSGVTLDNNIEYRIEHGCEAENRTLFSRRWADMVRTPPRKTKIVHDPVFKGSKEKLPLSHAEDGNPHAEEPVKHPNCCKEFPKAVKSETGIDVSLPIDNFPASISEAHDPQPENENSDAKRTEEISASSSDNPKLKTVENNPVVDNIILGCTTNDARSGSENGISTASPNGSTQVMVGGENVSVDEAATRPFFLVKIPKLNDGKLREQIKHAQLEVDEKTRLRNVIQLEIQKTRENYQGHGVQYEAAMIGRRAARKLVRLKSLEIDSLHSVISRAKNVMTYKDMESRICNMEQMIQHETLPLKEEKQLIHEIKQLKQQHEKLSHNMGSQDEIQQALDQREEVEERLKILKKELDDLKDEISKTEEAALAAGRKSEDENRKAEELRVQFRATDDIRQAAYAQLQSLRKELFDKNTHFRAYISDAAAARDCAFKKDTKGLHRLCINQVEKIMELWNTNNEFRNDYVKQNARSTFTRFKTLDGRSLGPDEAPPLLPDYADERVGKLGLTPAKAGSIQSSPLELSKPKNCTATNKEPTKPVFWNALATVSGDDVINEMEKKAIKSKEEVKVERKVEEEMREEAEPKSKNQHRQEEIAKAMSALERKKKNEEKAQRRAEVRAQKEAEQKEKERDKRLRKKERKKGASTASSEVSENTNVCETAKSFESLMENVKETDRIKERNFEAAATTKRRRKISKTKYNIPPAIVRSRNKKKWQHWMWLILACLVVVALFLLGKRGIFKNVNHKWW